MRLRCDGIFNMFHYTFTAKSDGERILKIDQHWQSYGQLSTG